MVKGRKRKSAIPEPDSDDVDYKYEINSSHTCKYTKKNVTEFYEAKILKRKVDKNTNKKTYFIHWNGWNKRHDQWIDENDVNVSKDLKNSPKKLTTKSPKKSPVKKAKYEVKVTEEEVEAESNSVINVEKATANVTSLKISTRPKFNHAQLKEIVLLMIDTILFEREVYQSKLFKKLKKYNQDIVTCSHEQLIKYNEKGVTSVIVLLDENRKFKQSLNIFSEKSNEPKSAEIWDFHFNVNEKITPTEDHEISENQIQPDKINDDEPEKDNVDVEKFLNELKSTAQNIGKYNCSIRYSMRIWTIDEQSKENVSLDSSCYSMMKDIPAEKIKQKRLESTLNFGNLTMSVCITYAFQDVKEDEKEGEKKE